MIAMVVDGAGLNRLLTQRIAPSQRLLNIGEPDFYYWRGRLRPRSTDYLAYDRRD